MIMELTPSRPKRRPCRCPSAGMGDVSALVIGAQTNLSPPALRRRGMEGIGASLLDEVSGGKVSQIKKQLDKLEVGLKVAIASSVFAGVMTLVALRRK